MKGLVARAFPVNRWLEPLLAFIVIGGLVRAIVLVLVQGYLPQPYFYDPNDVWMDWFNTAEWAHDQGAYDSWQTVYAPLTFVFLRAVGLGGCYLGAGSDVAYYARQCDWVGVIALHASYAIAVALTARVYYRTDRTTALPRSIALGLSLPMTSALERGNVVLVAFVCLVLATGPLLKRAQSRWIAMGLAINLKLYLLPALLVMLVRRKWRWVEGGLLATAVLYLLSWGLYGAGSPAEIYHNIQGYQNTVQAGQFLDVLFAATYAPLNTLLNNQGFPMMSLIGSDYTELLLILLPALQHAAQLAILLALAAAWLRPDVVAPYRLMNLALAFALISVESGGYTQMFVMYFAFMERWRGRLPKMAIVCTYFLCFQFDYIIDRAPPIVRQTFFGNNNMIVTYYIMLGPFVRPLLFYAIPVLLAGSTIAQVWGDISTQAWRSRRRYRRDLPIMLGPDPAPSQ